MLASYLLFLLYHLDVKKMEMARTKPNNTNLSGADLGQQIPEITTVRGINTIFHVFQLK